MADLPAPVPLERRHEVGSFHSGVAELDQWLTSFGWVNHASGTARVFVVTTDSQVVGYYTLSAASVAKERVPSDLLKGGAPQEIPCLLLGRLAVTIDQQGRRLGRSLLTDALWRTARLSTEIGIRALLIHARDDAARTWYLHQARSFQPSPVDPLHLYLPIKVLRRLAQDG